MIFNKTTSYALNVLNFMAGNERKIYPASYLHKQLGIPKDYLRTLLTRLSEKSLIRSVRGRNGGYIIARDIRMIFLTDIIDAVQGRNVLHSCIMGFEKCPFDHQCIMHDIWEDTRKNITKVLNKTSLAYLKKTSKN